MLRIHRRHTLVVLTAVVATTVVPVAPSFATEVAPPATVTAHMEDLPEAALPGAEDGTGVVEADVPFSMIGFTLPDGVDEVRVRTRGLDGTWSDWETLGREVVGLDGPDPGTAEARTAATDATEPLWVGDADAFEARLDGEVADLGASLIDTEGLSEGVVTKVVRHLRPQAVPVVAEAASRPAIISRAGWGANEALRTRSASYATPRFAVIHHTAGSNTYTKAQSASVVRGIYSYHAQTLKWGDIGYNVLVDRYGQIFEGRAGGLERGVVGAHAANFNTGSFGVSVMGNFETADLPTAAFEAVAKVVAWKYRIHGIDARAGRTVTHNGRTINVLAAHRDVGSTACPGRYFFARMGNLRNRVAALAATSSSPAPAPTKPATRFADVPASHAHFRTIEEIARRRITTGCTARDYCPSRTLTRGQMATFLYRAFDLPDAAGRPFRDVAGHPHERAIAAVAEAGIARGCARGRFCPDAPVTRAQMATFLQRALALPDARSPFTDTRRNPHEAAIGAVARAGIAKGYGDTYRPGEDVTRAAMATFLSRALAHRERTG
ncbi:S-layer homology domain-containing protein [Egicoccus sp. AB-alg2]|uniref:S-layer homology domain-containing protein n=1 Tax=Egicoccus sp. AB-alg2 TaxID=3242693 RepID=UPI00359DFE89